MICVKSATRMPLALARIGPPCTRHGSALADAKCDLPRVAKNRDSVYPQPLERLGIVQGVLAVELIEALLVVHRHGDEFHLLSPPLRLANFHGGAGLLC